MSGCLTSGLVSRVLGLVPQVGSIQQVWGYEQALDPASLSDLHHRDVDVYALCSKRQRASEAMCVHFCSLLGCLPCGVNGLLQASAALKDSVVRMRLQMGLQS